MGLRILVVDDNEMVRVALRSLLRHEGHVVVGEAGTGERALELIDQLMPDVVLLDFQMPGGMTGLDVLFELRRRLPAVKVIMVTGASDRDCVESIVRAGASGIVLKPIEAGRVLSVLYRCAQRKPAR